MNIDHGYFKAILGELIEENSLACQGVLSISGIEFTDAVETLAVTLCEDPPRLLVNLAFIREHCESETHVKSLLLHEFLHVLLNHTGKYGAMDQPTNLALDAVINHIVHRSCGTEYSDFFRRYYEGAQGWMRLLRPEAELGAAPNARGYDFDDPVDVLRFKLMQGDVLADDILELIRTLGRKRKGRSREYGFLGNHDPALQSPGAERTKLSPVLVAALDETARQLNGHGIFREPADEGFVSPGHSANLEWRALEKKRRRWEAETWELLRELLSPDPRSRNVTIEACPAVMPVLNGADRRGFLRTLWNPIIPDIQWTFEREKPLGSVQVYLDVSGSMEAEIQAIVSLLNRFRNWIRTPFWAFSTQVVPATIEKGVLKTSTSGGTSMNCVLEHIARTKPEKALVVTDGYIERCDPKLLRKIRGQDIRALISRDGSTAALDGASIPCRQLSKHPDSSRNHRNN